MPDTPNKPTPRPTRKDIRRRLTTQVDVLTFFAMSALLGWSLLLVNMAISLQEWFFPRYSMNRLGLGIPGVIAFMIILYGGPLVAGWCLRPWFRRLVVARWVMRRASTKGCAMCGYTLSDAERFCPECGYRHLKRRFEDPKPIEQALH